MSIKSFNLSIFLVLVSFGLYGQTVTYEDLYTQATFEAHTHSTSKEVGVIAASGDVVNGTSSYSIPLQIPAGTNGVAPELSIGYSSQGNIGHLGFGWALNGISTITRGLNTIHQDGKNKGVRFNTSDAFLYDGIRLVQKTATEYVKEVTDYTKIEAVGSYGTGPLYFRAETKNGVKLIFGKDFNSRLLSEDGSEIIFWKVSQVIYEDGNYINYYYNNGERDHRLAEIKYTGNSIAGISPYNSIKFNYIDRGDMDNATYEAGSEVNLKYLLDNIEIKAEGSLMKKYSFTYATDDLNVFLKKVTESGSDGTELNPTIFKYGDTPVNFSYESIATWDPDIVDIHTGDYNGDGYTDILRGYRYNVGNYFQSHFDILLKEPADNNNFQTPIYQALSGPGLVSTNPYSYNFFNGDFTGDGKDDIVYTYSEEEDLTVRDLSSLVIYSLDDNNVVQSTTIGTGNIVGGGYFEYQHKFLKVGDFNGDGVMDIMLTVGETFAISNGNPFIYDYHAYIYYGNISTGFEELSYDNSSSLGFVNLSALTGDVVDMDGNGRNEVLLRVGNISRVFEIEDTSVSAINTTDMSYPSQDQLVYFGDFNGDKKTDILTRNSLNDQNATWNIGRSDGEVFQMDSQPFIWTQDPPDITELNMGELLVLADYNGDGRSDIARGVNFAPNATAAYIQSYYSKGKSFELDEFLISDRIEQNSYIAHDFNGDGRSELINRDANSGEINLIKLKPNGRELLLEQVKNGHDHVTTFDYELMTRVGDHYDSDDSGELYPVDNVNVPMYLPTSIDKEGYVKTTYEYFNAKLNKEGRGFLGFDKITSISQTEAEEKLEMTYQIDAARQLMLPDVTSRYKDGILQSSETYTNTMVTKTDAISGVDYYTHHITQIDEVNAYEGTQSSTSTVFDEYGNATLTTIVDAGILTTTIGVDYEQHGSHIPSSPSNTVTIVSRSGQPSFITTETKTYNSIGQLQTKTLFPSSAKSLTYTYTYNNTGNINTTTLSAPGEDDRTSTSVYDSKGRYIESAINTLGQSSSATYDPKWSKPLSSTGIDGLTESYTYDGFGRLKTTTMPQGFQVVEDYSWHSGIGIWKQEMTHPGSANTTLYYDNMDRKIRNNIEGYGTTLVAFSTYDERGNVHISNSPSSTYTTTLYDSYNRPTSITDEYGTTTIVYSMGAGGELTATTTNAAGQVSSTVTDATGKVISSTDYGGTLDYTYHSNGELKSSTMDGTELISTTYDVYGRQTGLVDVDAGPTTYEYDAFGQLVMETSQKGTTTMTYDKLSQVKTRTGPEGTTTYVYYPTGSGASTNKLHILGNFDGDVDSYTYDGFDRPLTTTKNISGESPLIFSYTYDIYDRVDTHTYPSGLVLDYDYDSNGYLTDITSEGHTVYKLIDMNSDGKVTEYQSIIGGTTTTTERNFNNSFPTYLKHGDKIEQTYNWNFASGNLDNRILTYENSTYTRTENFTYDNLNRLKTYTLPSGTPHTVNYLANGNIDEKTDAGLGYSYHSAKIHAVNGMSQPNYSGGLSMFKNFVDYTSFQQPSQIREGDHLVNFLYGADYQRKKSISSLPDGSQETRVYCGDYEKVYNSTESRELHYVNIGYGIHMVIVKESGNYDFHSATADYLGSVVYLANEDTSVEHYMDYDPYGRRRDYTSGSYAAYSGPLWFARGYTGHEHLDDYQLINMNGRLYDPVIGRMLSPDNNIQLPFYSQNYNRYSYALNNPLRFTDPDGEFIVSALVGAAIAVVGNGINNVAHHRSFFDGALKSAAFGAIGGALSFGIGELATAIAPTTSKLGVAAFQAYAHGLVGETLSVLQGAAPGSGFLSGALSSSISSSVDALGGGATAMIISGGLSGGVGSHIAGGDFWNGVSQGLITSGLNHAAHSGVFGGGLAIALATGRLRHMFGPDARAYIPFSYDVTVLFGFAEEYGEIEILAGPEIGRVVGFQNTGTGYGANVGWSVGISDIYYTGFAKNFGADLLIGTSRGVSGGAVYGGGAVSVSPITKRGGRVWFAGLTGGLGGGLSYNVMNLRLFELGTGKYITK